MDILNDEHGDYDVKQHLDLVASWNTEPSTAFLSRYYTLHYHVENNDLDQAVYVRQAPNKVCVLGITPRHPALSAAPVRIESALKSWSNIKPGTVILELVNSDHRYPIRAHMHGKLLEINPRLADEPELLSTRTMTEGYLAIISAAHEDTKVQLKEYITADEFQRLVEHPA